MLTLSLALPSLGSQPPVGGEDGMQRGAAGVLAGQVEFDGVLVCCACWPCWICSCACWSACCLRGHAGHEEAAGLEAPASVLASHLDLLLLFFKEAAGTLCSSCCLWEGEKQILFYQSRVQSSATPVTNSLTN